MPSPIGHGLIGCATGILLAVPPGPRRRLAESVWRARGWLLASAAAANAPDIDYLPGWLAGELNAFHQGPTHSLFWAVLAAAGIGLLAQRVRRGIGWETAAVVFLAMVGHLAADLVCEDRSAPYGIPLLWPISRVRLIAPRPVFLAMDKATLAEVFSPANLGPAWRELWVGGLCLGAALLTRLRPGRRAAIAARRGP